VYLGLIACEDAGASAHGADGEDGRKHADQAILGQQSRSTRFGVWPNASKFSPQ
jgi:hypothetical protein